MAKIYNEYKCTYHHLLDGYINDGINSSKTETISFLKKEGFVPENIILTDNIDDLDFENKYNIYATGANKHATSLIIFLKNSYLHLLSFNSGLGIKNHKSFTNSESETYYHPFFEFSIRNAKRGHGLKLIKSILFIHKLYKFLSNLDKNLDEDEYCSNNESHTSTTYKYKYDYTYFKTIYETYILSEDDDNIFAYVNLHDILKNIDLKLEIIIDDQLYSFDSLDDFYDNLKNDNIKQLPIIDNYILFNKKNIQSRMINYYDFLILILTELKKELKQNDILTQLNLDIINDDYSDINFITKIESYKNLNINIIKKIIFHKFNDELFILPQKQGSCTWFSIYYPLIMYNLIYNYNFVSYKVNILLILNKIFSFLQELFTNNNIKKSIVDNYNNYIEYNNLCLKFINIGLLDKNLIYDNKDDMIYANEFQILYKSSPINKIKTNMINKRKFNRNRGFLIHTINDEKLTQYLIFNPNNSNINSLLHDLLYIYFIYKNKLFFNDVNESYRENIKKHPQLQQIPIIIDNLLDALINTCDYQNDILPSYFQHYYHIVNYLFENINECKLEFTIDNNKNNKYDFIIFLHRYLILDLLIYKIVTARLNINDMKNIINDIIQPLLTFKLDKDNMNKLIKFRRLKNLYKLYDQVFSYMALKPFFNNSIELYKYKNIISNAKTTLSFIENTNNFLLNNFNLIHNENYDEIMFFNLMKYEIFKNTELHTKLLNIYCQKFFDDSENMKLYQLLELLLTKNTFQIEDRENLIFNLSNLSYSSKYYSLILNILKKFNDKFSFSDYIIKNKEKIYNEEQLFLLICKKLNLNINKINNDIITIDNKNYLNILPKNIINFIIDINIDQWLLINDEEIIIINYDYYLRIKINKLRKDILDQSICDLNNENQLLGNELSLMLNFNGPPVYVYNFHISDIYYNDNKIIKLKDIPYNFIYILPVNCIYFIYKKNNIYYVLCHYTTYQNQNIILNRFNKNDYTIPYVIFTIDNNNNLFIKKNQINDLNNMCEYYGMNNLNYLFNTNNNDNTFNINDINLLKYNIKSVIPKDIKYISTGLFKKKYNLDVDINYEILQFRNIVLKNELNNKLRLKTAKLKKLNFDSIEQKIMNNKLLCYEFIVNRKYNFSNVRTLIKKPYYFYEYLYFLRMYNICNNLLELIPNRQDEITYFIKNNIELLKIRKYKFKYYFEYIFEIIFGMQISDEQFIIYTQIINKYKSNLYNNIEKKTIIPIDQLPITKKLEQINIKFTSQTGGANHIINFEMGKGKTSVIIPLLILFFILIENKEVYIILPEHLKLQTKQLLLIYLNIFKIQDKCKIVSDIEIKTLFLNNEFNDDSTNKIFLIDEFDYLLDPIKSNFNQIIDYNTDYKLDTYISIIEKYLSDSSCHLDEGTGPGTKIIIQELDKIKENIETSNLIENINWGISEKNGYAIPFMGKDKPMEKSNFSSILVTIYLTIYYYYYLYKYTINDIMYKYINENNIMKKIFKNYNEITPTLVSEYLNNTKKDNFKILLNYIFSNLKIANLQYNVSFVDILNIDNIYKIGFSGTMNVDLPDIKKNCITKKEIIKDNDLVNIEYAIKNSKIINLSKEQFNNFFKEIDWTKYDAIIDICGMFKSEDNLTFVKKLYDNLPSKRPIIFLDYKDNKYVYDDNILNYDESINYTHPLFYYSQSHIIGIDINQNNYPKMNGITFINKMSGFNYTSVAQGIFRLRKLNMGHTIEFVILDVDEINNGNLLYDKLIDNEKILLESKKNLLKLQTYKSNMRKQFYTDCDSDDIKRLYKEKKNYNIIKSNEIDLYMKNIFFELDLNKVKLEEINEFKEILLNSLTTINTHIEQEQEKEKEIQQETETSITMTITSPLHKYELFIDLIFPINYEKSTILTYYNLHKHAIDDISSPLIYILPNIFCSYNNHFESNTLDLSIVYIENTFLYIPSYMIIFFIEHFLILNYDFSIKINNKISLDDSIFEKINNHILYQLFDIKIMDINKSLINYDNILLCYLIIKIIMNCRSNINNKLLKVEQLIIKENYEEEKLDSYFFSKFFLI